MNFRTRTSDRLTTLAVVLFSTFAFASFGQTATLNDLATQAEPMAIELLNPPTETQLKGWPSNDPISRSVENPMDLELQWIWNGDSESSASPLTCSTPLVAQLDDDNYDGVVDTDDQVDVLILHFALADLGTSELSFVDGASGITRGSLGSSVYLAMPAVGDLDGDGRPEIVVADPSAQSLSAYSTNGQLIWTTESLPGLVHPFDTISLADLDLDGRFEVIIGATVFNFDGQLRFRGIASQGIAYGVQISNAIDVDLTSPGLEIVAGNSLYSANGELLWHQSDAPDGFSAVGDLDGDGQPEIVIATQNRLTILSAAGEVLWDQSSAYNARVSHPTLADFDGDGDADIFLAEQQGIGVYVWNGRSLDTLWANAASDLTGMNGASAYDFDGDGVAEIIYHDEVEWSVIDGATGTVRNRLPFASATGTEVPVIANLDRDAAPEVLISGCRANGWPADAPNAVEAWEWPKAKPARGIWNQYGYHVTNVSDLGAAPDTADSAWQARKGWLFQTSVESVESPCGSCEAFIQTIESNTKDSGLRQSLKSKAQRMCAALDRDQPRTAAKIAGALAREIRALVGVGLSQDQASAIMNCLDNFREAAGF